MPHPLNAVVVASFVAEIAGALLVLAALLGLRRVFPRAHMEAWSWAWLAAVVREAASFILALYPTTGAAGTAARAVVLVLAYVQAAWLVVGALEFARSAGPPPVLRRIAVGGA